MAFPVNRFLVSILCIISFPFRTISASLPPASTLLPSNADWDITVQRGKYVFAQLESGCYPDDPNPPTLEELRAHGWTLGEPGSVEPWPPKRELYEYFPKWVMRAINMDSPDFYNPILQHGTGMSSSRSAFCPWLFSLKSFCYLKFLLAVLIQE